LQSDISVEEITNFVNNHTKHQEWERTKNELKVGDVFENDGNGRGSGVFGRPARFWQVVGIKSANTVLVRQIDCKHHKSKPIVDKFIGKEEARRFYETEIESLGAVYMSRGWRT
jgi:hypothetical protein